MAHWYAVQRRYRVSDIVYVKAQTAKEAEEKARIGDYGHVTDAEQIAGSPTAAHARRRRGVPRWVWEEMGCPDDVAIESGV